MDVGGVSAHEAWGVWVTGRSAQFGTPEGWSRDGETGLTLVTDEADARATAYSYSKMSRAPGTTYEARSLPAALAAQVAQQARAAVASRRPRPRVVPPPRDLIPYRTPAERTRDAFRERERAESAGESREQTRARQRDREIKLLLAAFKTYSTAELVTRLNHGPGRRHTPSSLTERDPRATLSLRTGSR